MFITWAGILPRGEGISLSAWEGTIVSTGHRRELSPSDIRIIFPRSFFEGRELTIERFLVRRPPLLARGTLARIPACAGLCRRASATQLPHQMRTGWWALDLTGFPADSDLSAWRR